ncbi:MAG: sulfatase [Verrucomicrobiaceae bacterium]|nr:MAG: sulfatase [Verrucomicrobiaceae bacterium]
MKLNLLSTGLLALASLPAFAADRKPNVLIIVADDLGYGETGAQGFAKDIPTPNIDSIAANGTRFTSGYVSGPYCSPTRAGLLTGRYQQRFGHEFNPGPPVAQGEQVGLSLGETTIGDRFKKAGYATGWFGKSHLGNSPEHHPLSRGFDEFYGFLGGAHSYLKSGADSENPILRGREIVRDPGYLTEDFAKEAVSFIERKKDDPWFVYLPFNAVHAPLEVTEKYEARFASIKDEKRRKFAGLLSALDDGVGSVLSKVRELGLEEDTLVVFIADNGGPTEQISSGNGPLRGFKSQTWEGGIRVPFSIQWKGTIPAAKVDARPVIQLDLLPTALAAAGVEADPAWKLDGVNLLPYLKGEKTEAPHDALYWRFGQQLAIRKGDWKLVKGPVGNSPRGTATVEGAQLYNLAEDIGETTDLAAKNPEKVKELADQWNKWNGELVAPKWYPNGGRGGRGNRAARSSQAATPSPWKTGDSLDGSAAPQVANRAFVISAQVDSAQPEGVILGHGGPAQGYALHVKDGKLALSVRINRQLSTVVSEEAFPAGKHDVEALVSPDGTVALKVDGKPIGAGKLAGLIARQPGEGLHVGNDGDAAVGEYDAPAEFSGTVSNVTVSLK